MPTPPISLIFVNYRSAARLSEALASLRRFPLPAGTELIFVNNDPEEAEALEALSATHQAKLIEMGGNYGFGAAINRGARAAAGRTLGFLNPDIVVTEPIVDAVGAALGETEIIGLCLFTPDGRLQPYDHGDEVTLRRLIENHFAPKTRRNASLVAWVSGCAMFVRRDYFLSLGGFDEDFFLYYEDIDLCRRARIRGGSIRYLRKPSLVHLSGSSHTSKRSQKQAYFRSQRAYFRKHRPLWERLFLPLFQAVKRFFS